MKVGKEKHLLNHIYTKKWDKKYIKRWDKNRV